MAWTAQGAYGLQPPTTQPQPQPQPARLTAPGRRAGIREARGYQVTALPVPARRSLPP